MTQGESSQSKARQTSTSRRNTLPSPAASTNSSHTERSIATSPNPSSTEAFLDEPADKTFADLGISPLRPRGESERSDSTSIYSQVEADEQQQQQQQPSEGRSAEAGKANGDGICKPRPPYPPYHLPPTTTRNTTKTARSQHQVP
ncbi:hypothetical protein B0A50_05441 [Salinomyces thailandicus]|uniref:Uncharacterized protein n=1 Tax=Salinomyces thailandicus TaxID=706561 RepID=A0A4U0TTN0_9PEZI|nr:hypothetical protein B0A50_05441 [Salinomyces thailandica]